MPKIRCKCKRLLSFKPEQAGKLVKCPACFSTIRLPEVKAAQPSPSHQGSRDLDKLLEERPASDEGGAAKSDTTVSSRNELKLQPVEPLPHRPTRPAREEPAAPRSQPSPQRTLISFWAALPGAFAYPLTLDGLAVLFAGVLFFSVARFLVSFLGFVPFIGWALAVLAHIMLTGYFTGYLMSIMETSARGELDPPDWPDLNDCHESVLKPFLFMLVLGGITIGPTLAYSHFANSPNDTVAFLILATGLFYFPMGMLCAALTNNLAGLSPLLVFRAVKAAPGRYVTAWLLVIVAVAARLAGQTLLSALGIPFVSYLLAMAVSFYFMFVAARIMGLLCHTSGDLSLVFRPT